MHSPEQRVNAIDHEHRISIQISVGMSFYPQDGGSFEGLINRADTAMYRAKAAGGGEYRASET